MFGIVFIKKFLKPTKLHFLPHIMIVRIVKMVFKPEATAQFYEVFNAAKDKIKAFNGCLHVELLNDSNNKNMFCTYSHWQSEEHLEKYRQSELFKTTWAKTKVLFAEKPEAWTLIQLAD